MRLFATARTALMLGAALLASLSWGRSAHAVRLAYQAPREPEQRCPQGRRFQDEVSAILGFSPWRGSTRTVAVTIRGGKNGFVGVLRFDGTKRVEATSCRGAFDLLVAAAALRLDQTESRPRRGSVVSSSPPHRTPGVADEPQRVHGYVMPDTQKTLETWSFAERNNDYQVGLHVTSYAGVGVNGSIPIPRSGLDGGRLEPSFAQGSTSSSFGEGSRRHIALYYLHPVLYINEGSAFEVPLLAGGGIGYASYEYDQDMGTDTSDSAIMPTALAGTELQFRGFPVAFSTQMAFSLVEPPLTGSRLGFNFLVRYVFRGDE